MQMQHHNYRHFIVNILITKMPVPLKQTIMELITITKARYVEDYCIEAISATALKR